MVYFIILQPISQAFREKIRPAGETIAADRRQCVPGVTLRFTSTKYSFGGFVAYGGPHSCSLPRAS